MRPRGLQQIGDDVVDARDFLANVLDHSARGAGRGKVAADDLDDAGNSRQRVANFMCEPGGQFSQSGQVLGARHLGAVQALDFSAALAQLSHHLIEVAAQVSDLVVAVRKTYGNCEIAATELRDFLLQFDHRALHGISEHHQQSTADGDGSCPGDQ